MDGINSEKDNPRYETGVIHGRFQVLHHDHLEYLMAGKQLCRHLVIGITNPDPSLVREETVDPKRSNPLANPLTYYERYLLVRSAVQASGMQPEEFSIVPFPINLPEHYHYYVPADAVYFLSIYDEWGRQKLKYFRSTGLKTHVLRDVSPEEKGISAGDIRAKMIGNQPWEHLVPQSVAVLMKQWRIPARLKKLYQAAGNSAPNEC